MLRYLTVPVTPFEQNCSIVWCDETMEAAIIDPGGDLPRLKEQLQRLGVKLTAIWLTHAHIDHAGAAGQLAQDTGVPIIGPQEDEQFWIDLLLQQAGMFGFPPARSFTPTRWLHDGDTVSVGRCTLQVRHCPGHTPGHVILKMLEDAGGAVFCGDVLHHPIQVLRPDWSTRFCDDPVQAAVTRRQVLEHCAAARSLLFPTHFAAPHVAAIERAPGEGFRPRFVPCC